MASKSTSTTDHGKLETVPFFINGKDVLGSKTFDVSNPATGKVVHKCSSAGEDDALAAVDAAAKALPAWKALLPPKRREILLKAAEVMERRREELATTHMEELGVPRQWADFNITVAQSLILDAAGRLVAIEGSIPTPQDPSTGALVLREPFGVVLAIAPWNAPYILGTRSVVFPLAAGNTVVFKPSEFCPKTMRGICSVLAEAGLPEGVLNMIVHEPANAAAVTASLIAHDHIKKVNFTGSTIVGRIIGKLAGQNLKPVLLELGGKAPAIVCEDANLDLAAQQCTLGAFLNSGQICMSTEKIIVHKTVAAEFEKKFAEFTKKIFPATADAPVLITQPAVEKNKKLLRDATGKGATLLHGDFEAAESSATRLRPVIIKGITAEMDLYRTESFGPSVALYEFESDEEALRIANDTEYGLSSAVFTEDLRRGLRLAKGIETGACHINSMSVHDEAALPHGGAKASGFGRFNASIGLDDWVRTKTITYQY
ncbi:aldehyde dehydrogenase [Cryphonectria parasitica EP155]|uniref:Aldehyde dehydrogenase n=1 Tax=Cryphonectria parasitica (strain ATCC 38755 / EP155) TaxID=660469 RepID=A0A9P5CLL8_CRYP1|nr:aldehyde dehydrogenase [Cryphonectria parasitica EP155]KAF3762156.1 aldehyde dehydrogenase [Cryphonectria parasitica EP155]